MLNIVVFELQVYYTALEFYLLSEYVDFDELDS